MEKALFESDLGMTPNSDGKVIRLNVPQLTTDRRKELTKTAKALGEDGKVRPICYDLVVGSPGDYAVIAWNTLQVAIRNIRKSAIDKVKKMKKAIGEDAVKDAEESVQKVVKKYEAEVTSLVDQREKEIMTV